MKKLIPFFIFLTLSLALEGSLGSWLNEQWLSLESKRANQRLKELQSIQLNSLEANTQILAFQSLLKNKELGFHTYLFVRGKLTNWSDNQENIAVSESDLFRLGKSWITTSEGSYLSANKLKGDSLLISLIKIENCYPVNNSYLKNEPNPSIGWNIQTLRILSENKNKGTFPELKIEKIKIPILSLLSLIFWLLVFFFCARLIEGKRVSIQAFGLIAFLIIRLASLYFKFPNSIYYLDWFSPQHYAYSWWSPSIGDWFINALLFFWISRKVSNSTKHQSVGIFIKKLFFLLANILGPWGLLWCIQNICSHSQFFLDPSYLVKLEGPSWLAMCGLCLIGGGVFRIATLFQFSRKENIILSVSSTFIAIALIWAHWRSELICLALLPFSGGVFLYSVLFTKKIIQSPSTQTAAAGLFIAAFLSVGINHFNLAKETTEVRYLGSKLLLGRDWVQEYLFKKISHQLKTDRKIKNSLSVRPLETTSTIEAIRSHFKEEWSNFELGIILKTGQDSILYSDFAKETIDIPKIVKLKSKSELTETDGLWLVSPGNNYSYLADITLTTGRGNQSQHYQLFLLFWKKLSQNHIGYPELLLEKGIGYKDQLQNYSYRVISKDSLATENSSHLQRNIKGYESKFSWNKQELSWDVNSSDGETKVAISRPYSPLTYYLNVLTVLFSIFFITNIFLTFLMEPFSFDTLLFTSFRNRIVFITTGLLTLTLVVIGFATARLMIRQIQNKNMDLAGEKITAIHNRIKKEAQFSNSVLFDLAQEYNVDMHLFDTAGILFSTSRPIIFEDGYCGKMMNPAARQQVKSPAGEIRFFNENIGNLEFLSTYTQVKSREKTFYLNIPLFARQGEIQEELSSMVSSLMNIYFLMVALSVILTLLLSRYITLPLKTMSEKLGNVDFKKPEYIQWKEQDEIGKLVKSYNHMVDELGKSIEELSKSEREMAWREMAKQVAHEIKNPLTPMKLQVQHLVLRYRSKSDGWEEQMEKTMILLEEQIDNLATIANAFSNFAKMPLGIPERFDARDILQNLYQLYLTESKTKISIQLPEVPVWVNMDKQQFSSAIQNLIKNAKQAIAEESKGFIHMTCTIMDKQVQIEVRDNGSGIPAEVQEKIFMPNFTTKSSGMGLGLALVKNSVEQANGKITFSTIPGEGTTFIILIPLSV